MSLLDLLMMHDAASQRREEMLREAEKSRMIRAARGSARARSLGSKLRDLLLSEKRQPVRPKETSGTIKL